MHVLSVLLPSCLERLEAKHPSVPCLGSKPTAHRISPPDSHVEARVLQLDHPSHPAAGTESGRLLSSVTGTQLPTTRVVGGVTTSFKRMPGPRSFNGALASYHRTSCGSGVPDPTPYPPLTPRPLRPGSLSRGHAHAVPRSSHPVRQGTFV